MKAELAQGLTFLQLLTITFLVLKLLHVIDWSWWFVLMPLWGPAAVSLVMFLLIFVTLLWATRKRKRRA